MHGIDRTVGRIRRDICKERGTGNAESNFLAFHIAACLEPVGRLIDTRGEMQVAGSLRWINDGEPESEQAPSRVHPWRSLPTIRPNVLVSAAPIRNISTISKRLVSAVGFSNGCAEFALKNPPPSPLMRLGGEDYSFRATVWIASAAVLLFIISLWRRGKPLGSNAGPLKRAEEDKRIGREHTGVTTNLFVFALVAIVIVFLSPFCSWIFRLLSTPREAGTPPDAVEIMRPTRCCPQGGHGGHALSEGRLD
jgi:hypothetical protein